jgi:hypothetical protein
MFHVPAGKGNISVVALHDPSCGMNTSIISSDVELMIECKSQNWK